MNGEANKEENSEVDKESNNENGDKLLDMNINFDKYKLVYYTLEDIAKQKRLKKKISKEKQAINIKKWSEHGRQIQKERAALRRVARLEAKELAKKAKEEEEMAKVAKQIEDNMMELSKEEIAAVKAFEIDVLELTPKKMRAIEYYAQGMNYTECCKSAGFKDSLPDRCFKRIMQSKGAVEYLNYLQLQMAEKCYVEKEQMVRELMARVPGAKTAELVKITETLSRMFGWNEEKVQVVNNTVYSVEWAANPWDKAKKAKQEQVINCEVENPEDIREENGESSAKNEQTVEFSAEDDELFK